MMGLLETLREKIKLREVDKLINSFLTTIGQEINSTGLVSAQSSMCSMLMKAWYGVTLGTLMYYKKMYFSLKKRVPNLTVNWILEATERKLKKILHKPSKLRDELAEFWNYVEANVYPEELVFSEDWDYD